MPAVGQFWQPDSEGGYMYHDELSDLLRTTLQPSCKMRQFSEPREADKPLHKGEFFFWNIFGDVASDATTELGERDLVPEGDFTITQSSLVIKQMARAVPYSFKLEALAKQDIVSVVEKVLANNARKWFDAEVFTQFDATPTRFAPTGGTSTTALTVDLAGTCTTTNNVELSKEHINLIEDYMREQNVPPYMGSDIVCISRPTTLRPVKDDLEAIHIYTETGLQMVFEGEKGRYSGVRFAEQTNIAAGGAADSTAFNAYTATGDAWNNAKSSWAFFFGGDTVLECLVIPEEIRAKIPENFGLSKAIAWYFLGGYGLVHTDSTNSRIYKWDSAT